MLIKYLIGGLKKGNVGYRVFPRCSVYTCSTHLYCSEHDKETPVKFTTSPAAKWRAEYSRTGQSSRVPAAQPFIVNFSLMIFMLYFCFLREENDIDEELKANLYDRIEGLEEIDLKTAINYNESHGLDTTALQKRLDEVTKK